MNGLNVVETLHVALAVRNRCQNIVRTILKIPKNVIAPQFYGTTDCLHASVRMKIFALRLEYVHCYFYTPGIYAEEYLVFVFPFVCSFSRDSVLFVELLQSFTLKFLKWVYLTNHSSESIHIWTIATLEGRLSFHDS